MLLSILCHIWKIVPDLYEAIINLSGESEGHPDASIQLASNSTEEGFFEPKSNISGVDYLLNSSTYINEYDEISMKMNLDESQETFENIAMYETGDLSVFNCTDILRRFGNDYNLISTAGNYSSYIESQEGAAQQVRQN